MALSRINANSIQDGTITSISNGNSNVTIASANSDVSIFTSGNAAASFDSNQVFKFNSGYGSVATAYGCRAWVNFDGTGTPAIREDGNVSSITDNGTGDYTVNFTTAMPDANYSVCGLSSMESGQAAFRGMCLNLNTAMATTAFRIRTDLYNGTAEDKSVNTIAVFR